MDKPSVVFCWNSPAKNQPRRLFFAIRDTQTFTPADYVKFSGPGDMD